MYFDLFIKKYVGGLRGWRSVLERCLIIKKMNMFNVKVKFSMLEIYNENVRDLLDPNGAKKKGGLKVRQHPKRGFYGKN